MCDYNEDEPPCIHHRSQFDTIPAPPPVPRMTMLPARKPSEPTLICAMDSSVTRWEDQSGNGAHATWGPGAGPSLVQALRFPGGDVELPKPTRADLVLSAQQWATAIREHFGDHYRARVGTHASDLQMSAKLDRLDAILKELAES